MRAYIRRIQRREKGQACLRATLDPRAWREAADYGKRGKDESAFSGIGRLFGDRLRARRRETMAFEPH